MQTAGSQKQATPPRPDPLPRAAGTLYRVAFASSTAALLLAFLAGAVQSLRSERRIPSAGLILDGTADHIELLLGRKDYDEAVRQLAQYESMSNDRLAHERMGETLLRLGPEARAGVAQALRRRPGYAVGHYQLGIAFLGADEYDAAAAELREAVRLRSPYPEAHNALGVVLAYQGHGEEAAGHLWQALSQKPDYEEARINLERLGPLLEGSAAPEDAP